MRKNSDDIYAEGGSAFAAIGVAPSGDVYHEPGMTLRDYFAIHATEQDVQRKLFFLKDGEPVERTFEEARYAFADAMLSARDIPS